METQRPLALYTHLQGGGARRHRLPVHGDRGDEDGQRDVPALQSVREFNPEYERLLMHLRELDCELPPLVKALFRQAEVVRSRRDEHPQQCQQQV